MAKNEGAIQNTMTILVNTDVSDAIRVPRNCTVVTFFQPPALAVQGPVPGVTGVAIGVSIGDRGVPFGYSTDETGTWRIQSMVPTSTSDSTLDLVWVDGTYWSPEGTRVMPLNFPFAANTALSFPSWMLGGGQIRINTSMIQPITAVFTVFFTGFNN